VPYRASLLLLLKFGYESGCNKAEAYRIEDVRKLHG